MRIFTLKLKERPFEAIKKGTKKIEIRANKEECSGNSVNLMKEGDHISFQKEGSSDMIKCVVRRVVLYPDVKSLLLKEGTKYALSSTDDLEEGIRSIESIGTYKELITKNGVFAIELKYIDGV